MAKSRAQGGALGFAVIPFVVWAASSWLLGLPAIFLGAWGFYALRERLAWWSARRVLRRGLDNWAT